MRDEGAGAEGGSDATEATDAVSGSGAGRADPGDRVNALVIDRTFGPAEGGHSQDTDENDQPH